MSYSDLPNPGGVPDLYKPFLPPFSNYPKGYTKISLLNNFVKNNNYNASNPSYVLGPMTLVFRPVVSGTISNHSFSSFVSNNIQSFGTATENYETTEPSNSNDKYISKTENGTTTYQSLGFTAPTEDNDPFVRIDFYIGNGIYFEKSDVFRPIFHLWGECTLEKIITIGDIYGPPIWTGEIRDKDDNTISPTSNVYNSSYFYSNNGSGITRHPLFANIDTYKGNVTINAVTYGVYSTLSITFSVLQTNFPDNWRISNDKTSAESFVTTFVTANPSVNLTNLRLIYSYDTTDVTAPELSYITYENNTTVDNNITLGANEDGEANYMIAFEET